MRAQELTYNGSSTAVRCQVISNSLYARLPGVMSIRGARNTRLLTGVERPYTLSECRWVSETCSLVSVEIVRAAGSSGLSVYKSFCSTGTSEERRIQCRKNGRFGSRKKWITEEIDDNTTFTGGEGGRAMSSFKNLLVTCTRE